MLPTSRKGQETEEQLRPAVGARAGVVAALIAVAALTGVASAHDTTGASTLEQTIDGLSPENEFRFLRLDEGEPYLVREGLARARAGRKQRRRSLIYAGQITDFQLSDEESPARVEFLDRNPLSEDFQSAHRPQEALVAHQVDFTIRQLNRFVRSPVEQGNGKRARMVNAVMTGDLADNQHRNETEQVMRLLEGGTLDPNSGSTDPADYADEPSCAVLTRAQRAALIAEALSYTGVQDYDDYPTGVPPDDDFYDPDDPQGEYAPARKDFPRYTGLLDRAQEPFLARGLEVPSYVAFGNHNGLAQGNEDAIAPFERIGTGCLKVFPGGGFTGLARPEGPSALDVLLRPRLEDRRALVPPDEDRQYVDKAQFKAVFAGGEQADDHGFAFVDQDELHASNGAAAYYSFVPFARNREVRYIVLDTLSEGGVVDFSSRGNIDDPQWQWLQAELRKAERRDELVIVWAHHATGSLDANVRDELAAPCTANDEHGHDVNPGCDRDPRSSTPLHFGDDLERLFHRFPNVIALIAGHSHENEIQPFADDDGEGDFWEIKSPAIVDWPPQHRLIEVMDNRDGTLSIFATLLDHDGPSRAPGESKPVDEMSPAELASVGRTIGYNDPQVGPGPPEGRPRDRNVELLLRDPRAPGGDGRDEPGGDGEGRREGEDGGRRGRDGAGRSGRGGDGAAGAAEDTPVRASLGTAAGGGGGDLPFTGLSLLPVALLGAALLGAGTAARARSRRP